MAKMQVFTYDNLALYDTLLKGYVDKKDAEAIKTVALEELTDGYKIKFYKVTEPVGSTSPAYEVVIPKTDISGLMPKLTGATTGDIVSIKADGTLEDAGIKATDLATKAEVKTVQDAVDILNGADTVEGSVAKSIKDLKTTLDADIATAKASGDNAQTAVDALAEKVGTVPEDKTVVQMIQDAQTAATYDDTEVRGLIQDNAESIEAHKTAIDTTVATLVGDDTNKSVRTIANEELAAQLLSGKADADFKTLQELAAWLEDHPEQVAAINLDITNIKKLIGTIPEGATATDIVGYIKELVDAEKTRATGVESGLDTRLSAVETLVGEGGSVDEKIAAAKSEAISTAAADATTKANTAETNAKAYADQLDTAMDARVDALETKVGEGFEPISETFIRGLFA